MIEDLTMLANLPIADEKVAALIQAEADKAAAADTLPPAKQADADADDATDPEAERVARRGQDPPEQEKAGEEDS
jgi:hypothetical protein